MSTNIAEKWYKFCLIVLKQFYVNVLWIIFTLLGLVLFTIGPATIALLSVQNEFLCGNDDVSVFSTFISSFKLHFKEASVFGIIYVFAGIVLITNIYGFNTFFPRLFFGIISFFYLLSLIYIGPIIMRQNVDGGLKKIKASILYGFSYLHYSLVLLMLLVILYFFLLMNFGLLTFFGASAGAYLVMKFANTVFLRASLMQEEANQPKH